MNLFCRIVLGGVLAAGLGGCTLSLPKDLVPLPREGCPDDPSRASASYDSRSDTAELQCALGTLRSKDPGPVHATAAGSYLCFLLADRASDQQNRERFAAEGVRWAEIALEKDTAEEGKVRYYLAVDLGMAVRKHPALAVKSLKRMAENLEKACVLSPEVDQGGPLRVLGLLYLMAPPWPDGIGDGDKALELLRQAVEDYPGHPLNHVFYAQALWELEEDDARDQVRQHMQKARELIEGGDWGHARKRLLDEYNSVAEDAELKQVD